jgi:BASS family bile acid:Na+ symporter
MNRIINLFPLWAIFLAMVAYTHAEFFASFKSIIVPLLALVMFSMGMTLSWKDFKAVFKKPVVISLAVAIQFLLMPLFAYGLSRCLNLSTELMTGMVLVGTSAGGTASNVICYLAKGDVALSILMTVISTVCAVFLMPALAFLYLNQLVPVPVEAMLKSILMIVLLPVLTGTLINHFFSHHLKAIQVVFPLLSSLAIVLIIAIIVGLNQHNLSDVALPVLLAVCLHNSLGLVFGYFIPRLLKYDERTCRTVCIEVAMQNSGLSVALAIKHFSLAAALPGALFSIWHNVSGSLLALFWRRNDIQ